MLFGTYQAYPVDKNGNDCHSLMEAYREIDETIGFTPIYAFPIKSLEDFFAQSNMATMGGFDLLIMVETDDFLRVDKVAFEKDLFFKKVNKGLKNYVNDNLPDELTAFILKPEVFNNITFAIEVAGTAAFAVNEASFFEALDESYGWNEALSGISADFFKASFEMYVRSKANDIIAKTFSNLQEDSESEEITETMCDMACKRVLEEIFLPFVYHAVDKEAPNHYAVEACSNTSVILSHTRRNFADWMKTEDISKEKYMQFYNEFKKMPVLSESLQEALFSHEKISRNEPCPCGSGKKYKNCHGRILD